MPRGRWKTGLAVTGAILCLALFLAAAPEPPQTAAQAAAAYPVVLTFDCNQSKVHYMVESTLHTVHGTFNMKSGTVQFDPQTGKVDGSIVVLATSGDSGNSSRDARMHKEILETWKYQEAAFRPTQIDGTVSLTAPSDFKVKGVFTLHGADHQVVAQVHSEFTGDHWKGAAKFDVPYIQWGIKDPSNFLLKVQPVVHVELEISGAQAGSTPAK